jgi:hypothetical protein
MAQKSLRNAFIAFHLTLGAVIFWLSIQTAVSAARQSPVNLHLLILAGVETVAALLFLLPSTLRVGGSGLLLTFAVAIIAHALQGEFVAPLLVYAAGVIFVTVHGSAWTQPSASAAPRIN